MATAVRPRQARQNATLAFLASIAAVALAAISDQLREGYDNEANGAASADIVAIIVVAAIMAAIVFGGLHAWALRGQGSSRRAAVAALVLGAVTFPLLWFAGAPIIAGVGAWSFAGYHTPQSRSDRLIANLGVVLVVAAIITQITVVIAARA
jgi:hypothetical protein